MIKKKNLHCFSFIIPQFEIGRCMGRFIIIFSEAERALD